MNESREGKCVRAARLGTGVRSAADEIREGQEAPHAATRHASTRFAIHSTPAAPPAGPGVHDNERVARAHQPQAAGQRLHARQIGVPAKPLGQVGRERRRRRQ